MLSGALSKVRVANLCVCVCVCVCRTGAPSYGAVLAMDMEDTTFDQLDVNTFLRLNSKEPESAESGGAQDTSLPLPANMETCPDNMNTESDSMVGCTRGSMHASPYAMLCKPAGLSVCLHGVVSHAVPCTGGSAGRRDA